MRTHRPRLIVAGVVASTVLGFAAAAPAAYLQLTQDRVLTAHATASSLGSGSSADDPKTETSNALGSFDRSLTASARVPRFNFPNEFAQAGASASQAVTYGPESIGGVFEISGFNGTLAPGEAAGSDAASQLTARFGVDKVTPFHFTGDASLQRGGLGSLGTGSFTVAFNGDGPGESFYGDGGIGGGRTIDVSGVLQPGHVYTLIAQINAGKGGTGVSDEFQKEFNGNIHFTLAVPEPASAGALLTAGVLASLRRRRVRCGASGVAGA